MSGAVRVDAFLTEQSRTFSPATTEGLARQLLAVLDPDGGDRYDPDALRRPGPSCATDATGMLVGRFQLDPVGGAVPSGALAQLSCDTVLQRVLLSPSGAVLSLGRSTRSVSPRAAPGAQRA